MSSLQRRLSYDHAIILSLQCLLEENEVQKREIQRLKRDNAELILIAKTAATDRDTVLVSGQTATEAGQC